MNTQEDFLTPIRCRVDGVMMVTVAFLFLTTVVMGLIYDGMVLSLAIGIPALVMPFIIWRSSPGTLISRLAMASAFVIQIAIQIQVSRGMIEIHFGLFAVLAFLLAYRDWRPIVFAAGLIAVHHLACNFLQAAHWDVWVFRNGADFGVVLLHAAYVIVESIILVCLAGQLRIEGIEAATVAFLAERITHGDLDTPIDIRQNNETQGMLYSIKTMRETIKSLMAQMKQMAFEHDKGDIDVVIDVGLFEGDFKVIASDINNMVASHIAVKKQALACIKEFGEGNFDAPLEQFPGKRAFINDTIEQVRQDLKRLIEDADMLVHGALEGNLSHRADVSRHHGDFRKIIAGFNDTLDAVIVPIQETIAQITKYSRGDISGELTAEYKGEFAELKRRLNNLSLTIKGVIDSCDYVRNEHDKGEIDIMIAAEMFKGDFGKMAININTVLSSHIELNKKTMACVKEFGEGNFDAPLEQFPGKKAFINDTIEQMRGNLNTFIADMRRMSDEHDKGEIGVMIDTRKFHGSYGTMAQGVNDMVNGHIELNQKTMACVKEFGEGNFDAPLEKFPGKKAFINDTIEQVRGNLNTFIADMRRMSDEHDKGEIGVMIDTRKFHGSYGTMAQGVNNMVGGHIELNQKAMACVKEFGEGNFDAPLEKFPGKKAFINDTVEQVRANIQALIADTDMLAQAAAEGRVQIRADAGRHRGGFRRIVEDINATLESIVAPIIVVKTAADSINMAAKEIAAGNADLSHRTEQQAASLEETAASMEELAAAVKQNADNAKQANQMAVTAADVAVKGGNVIRQVVNTMSAINESSRKIVDIISVIDGIALQTNILALNAAVEAARAGEQGRGFAVVASEVRNLAQRSAAAAKEIKALISDSVEKVEDGGKLVGEAGNTMEEIVTSVQRVTGIMSNIVTASVEQSSGIEQVNQAIAQMDEVTQQNAALVEQAAAAAESLQEQASTLSQTMAQFQIGADGGRSAGLPVIARHKPAIRLVVGATKTSKIAAVSPSRSGDEWSEF